LNIQAQLIILVGHLGKKTQDPSSTCKSWNAMDHQSANVYSF